MAVLVWGRLKSPASPLPSHAIRVGYSIRSTTPPQYTVTRTHTHTHTHTCAAVVAGSDVLESGAARGRIDLPARMAAGVRDGASTATRIIFFAVGHVQQPITTGYLVQKRVDKSNHGPTRTDTVGVDQADDARPDGCGARSAVNHHGTASLNVVVVCEPTVKERVVSSSEYDGHSVENRNGRTMSCPGPNSNCDLT